MEGEKGRRASMIREKERERSGSVGILEIWKEKRKGEKEEDGGEKRENERIEHFSQRSKKTPRSPPVERKSGREEGSVMAVMKGWMEDLKSK